MQKSNTNDQDALLEKQVEPLFNSTLSGGLVNVFCAFLVYFLMAKSGYAELALNVCIGIIFASMMRICLSAHYLKIKSFKLKSYLGVHFLLTLSIGVMWGVCELLQLYPEDEAVRNIVFLINFGMIAGSITTLSTYRPAYLAYLLPQVCAIMYVFLSIDSDFSFYMATAFFVFMIFMISTSFSINRSHKNEIELLFSNKQLINQLNDEIDTRKRAQHELEGHKNELENKVRDRTIELESINTNLQKTIAKKEEAELSLQYLAYHDELTSLPNKNLLIDRIHNSIETACRNNSNLGILFIDLDRFKAINDSLGHIVGDKLIQEVAVRLQSALRKEDTVSRNGGDEFVVVIKRMENANEAILIAQKLIDRLTDIFEIDSHKIHIGASVGISVYPNDGLTALELIRNADTAMFAAKKSGGNRLQFYDPSMSNRLRERLEIESKLHTALSSNEFYLVYQPQINTNTSQTTGFEALLRWSNPDLGSVSPCDFIPLLEETGLIYEVGEWVVDTVVDFISSGDAGDAKVAINLSALQCGDSNLLNHVEELIERTAVDASQMEFEITESILINDFEETQEFLNRLHALGCSIALDDFGTGYTSMSYLTRLPIDGIKVDQSFVRDIHLEPALEDIVKAIVHMSSSLGISNTFEGVERKEELEVIKGLGGEIIQGYYYSPPVNQQQASEWASDINKASNVVLSVRG